MVSLAWNIWNSSTETELVFRVFLRWWFSSFIHRPFCNGIWLRWHSPHRPIFARILCHQYRIGRGTCIESIDSHRPNRPKFHYHQNEKSERSLDLNRKERRSEKERINEEKDGNRLLNFICYFPLVFAIQMVCNYVVSGILRTRWSTC